jgi:hypothetical protein
VGTSIQQSPALKVHLFIFLHHKRKFLRLVDLVWLVFIYGNPSIFNITENTRNFYFKFVVACDNKKYNTVGTILKYNTVGTILKYNTVGTVPKYNTVGTILKYNTVGTILKYHTVGTILKYHRISNYIQIKI